MKIHLCKNKTFIKKVVLTSILCICAALFSCDTIEDVEKMEAGVDNLFLLSGGVTSGIPQGPFPCNNVTRILTIGTPSSVYIGSTAESHYFYLNVPSSGNLTVETTGTIDTQGFVYNSSCNSLGNDNDSGTGTNFQIVLNGIPAGTYYIKVSLFFNPGGTYTLSATLN